MKKNWLIVFLIIGILIALYLIEFSKVKTDRVTNLPTLDNLHTDEISAHWEPFYKVRATIIDGQSASLSIPDELLTNAGKEIILSGVAIFRGNGCELIDSNKIRVKYFFLVPTLGLAQACEIQPDVAMRWMIRVNLAQPRILSRVEMIDTEVTVAGLFKIDTSKPYEAAFYVENANATLISGND